MSEVAVFSNPARRRRNRLGEFISTHRRKRRHRNPESFAERSAAAKRGAKHRHHRRYRNPESHRERVLAAIRGHRHHRRHRNPIAGTMGEMGNVIVPAAFGAAGALGINILLGKLTMLPASLQSGYGRAGVQVAGALAIGALGPKMGLSRRTASAIAAGITVIALYDVASTLIASKFPNVSLGETFPALPGNLMSGARVRQFQPTGMGEVFMTPTHPALAYTPNSQNTFG